MKIIISSDSFKGSASSLEVAKYLEIGIRKVFQNANIVKVPIADGGEGTLEALTSSLKFKTKEIEVNNPLGYPIKAKVGILEKDSYFVEMASASGITLIDNHELNPYITSTFGTGQLINYCIENGAKTIYIGIGGSATNDCGLGMLQALGIKFYDEDQNLLGFEGESILKVKRFDTSEFDRKIYGINLIVLSDVQNPLVGTNGASAIFGPQKGLSDDDVEIFDEAFSRFADLVSDKLNVNFREIPGSGAAGGLGFALLSFFRAEFRSGVTELLRLIDFDSIVNNADLIITGEGKIDNQTLQGKAIMGVLEFGKKNKIPVVAVAGSIPDDLSIFYDEGFEIVTSIINAPMNLNYAKSITENLLIQVGETLMRSISLSIKKGNT